MRAQSYSSSGLFGFEGIKLLNAFCLLIHSVIYYQINIHSFAYETEQSTKKVMSLFVDSAILHSVCFVIY